MAELVESLNSDSLIEREQATEELKHLGAAATATLSRIIESAEPEVASRARLLMRHIEIRGHLSQSVLERIPHVVNRLAEGGDAQWAEVFLAIVKHVTQSGKDISLSSIDDLRFLATQAVRGARSSGKLGSVSRAVARYELREAIPALLNSLWRASGPECQNIVEALVRLHASELVPEVVDLLKRGRRREVRLSALAILEGLETIEAVEALADLRHDGDEEVRRSAAYALGSMNSSITAKRALLYLDDESAKTRVATIEGLWAAHRSETVPNLVAHLKREPIPEVRGVLLEALSWMGGSQCSQDIQEHIHDEAGSVRVIAIYMVGDLCVEEAEPVLLPLLHTGTPRIQAAAARALARIGSTQARPGLLNLLDSEDPAVRLAAAESMCKLGWKEGIAPLLELAEADNSISLNALNAVRSCETWGLLAQTIVTVDADHEPRTIAKTLSSQALSIKGWHSTELARSVLWTLGARSDLRRRGQLSLLEALEHASRRTSKELVLDEDMVRLLDRNQALSFWRSWSSGALEDR